METITELEYTESDGYVARCACCGAKPQLFEVATPGGASKMVNCPTAHLFAEEFDSCPMYNPGQRFERPTRREAISYWNKVQCRLRELRDAGK